MLQRVRQQANLWACRFWRILGLLLVGSAVAEVPVLPSGARLVLQEDWGAGRVDPERWYFLSKKWGDGNNGVVPQNVTIQEDHVNGRLQKVLQCEAHGDLYDGEVRGAHGARTRVGGVLVSKAWFASGRFEVTMKIGETVGGERRGPPKGSVPAIWTYGYRAVRVPEALKQDFVPGEPLYNPLMAVYGGGVNEYWSEIDFPELGKNGDFRNGLFNTFCQNRHDWQTFPIPPVTDGKYHTYTMQWRTRLKPMPGVTDEQVVEHAGFWWVRDKSIPFASYLGNPLRQRRPNDYEVYAGEVAEHWIDGRKIGQNEVNVPCMAAQLNLGVWLPSWAGPAPWKTAVVSFGPVRVWQFDDPGDVRGILLEDITSNIP